MAKVSNDHAVFSDRIFVASGSGNFDTDHDLATQFALCPSYNAVCVGGYTHNDTLGPVNFGDLLRNRLYLGQTRHRDQWYPGEHKGIVPRSLWDRVQAQLNRVTFGRVLKRSF